MFYLASVIDKFSNFFTNIINTLTEMWNVISNTFESLFLLLKMVFQMQTVTTTVIGYVWSPIAVCVMLIAVVSVIKIVLGGNT